MPTMYEQIMKQTMARQSINYGVFNDGDCYKEIDGESILHCGICGESKQSQAFISTRTVEEFNQALEEFAIAHPNLEEAECHKKFMSIKPPKDKRRDLGIVGVPCKCQRDYKANITKAEMNDKERALIKENKYACFSSTVLLKETFNKYEENKFIIKAKGYAKKIGSLLNEKKNGLVFCGQSGAGKTVASICLANELLDRKFNVIFKIQQEITYIDYNNRIPYLNSLINCGILIIDDLNLELVTDLGREMLFYVIDGRVKRDKPIIITSNHTKEAITNPSSNNPNKRIFNRLNEACFIVEDNAHNYRSNI